MSERKPKISMKITLPENSMNTPTEEGKKTFSICLQI